MERTHRNHDCVEGAGYNAGGTTPHLWAPRIQPPSVTVGLLLQSVDLYGHLVPEASERARTALNNVYRFITHRKVLDLRF
ncbi:hypothetical protein GCM10022224_072430 [Nonomuraea antimicrobica]|uniref:Uncharacterized protein n=1 Tax=Nonomuraea antimicrobica TaxID=561173 RepID=A0ABP7CX77_9ACTN